MADVTQIVIDDGCKTYEIRNKEGDVLGSFRMNPSDTGILERYNGMVERLTKSIEAVDMASDDTQKVVEAITTASKEVKEAFSDLLGHGVDTFWNICAPFTPMSNGALFLEVVLEAVGSIIEKETNARVKKIQKHMEKYTSQYHK